MPQPAWDAEPGGEGLATASGHASSSQLPCDGMAPQPSAPASRVGSPSRTASPMLPENAAGQCTDGKTPSPIAAETNGSVNASGRKSFGDGPQGLEQLQHALRAAADRMAFGGRDLHPSGPSGYDNHQDGCIKGTLGHGEQQQAMGRSLSPTADLTPVRRQRMSYTGDCEVRHEVAMRGDGPASTGSRAPGHATRGDLGADQRAGGRRQDSSGADDEGEEGAAGAGSSPNSATLSFHRGSTSSPALAACSSMDEREDEQQLPVDEQWRRQQQQQEQQQQQLGHGHAQAPEQGRLGQGQGQQPVAAAGPAGALGSLTLAAWGPPPVTALQHAGVAAGGAEAALLPSLQLPPASPALAAVAAASPSAADPAASSSFLQFAQVAAAAVVPVPLAAAAAAEGSTAAAAAAAAGRLGLPAAAVAVVAVAGASPVVDPNVVTALSSQYRLACVLRQGGRAAESLAVIDQALLQHPPLASAQSYLAQAGSQQAQGTGGQQGEAQGPGQGQEQGDQQLQQRRRLLDLQTELLHQRAHCQQALGQLQEAVASCQRALALQPDQPQLLTTLGALYQAQGLLGEAVAAYKRAHQLRPDDQSIREGLAVALTDQGTKLKNAGAPLSEAVARYQAAAALQPQYAPALYNLGVVAGELRQLDAAVQYYRAAIAAEPRYAQAHCNLGVLLRERGQLAEAVAAYEAALAAAPNFAIVRNNLAIALTDLGTHVKNEGRLDEGISLYERALSYVPRHADTLYNLGVAYGEKGDLQRAAFMYEMALAFNPACAEAHNNLGVIWKERDNIDKAVECYTAALAVRPTFPQSLNNLGVVLTAQGRAAEALALLTSAVTSCPTYSEAYNNLGVLQRDVGCIPEAIASYSRCLQLDPDCRNAGQNRLLALNYIYQGEDDLVCSAHREWGERFQRLFTPLPPLMPAQRSLDPDRPLRIGYISPDLFTHSVSYFAEAPLTHHSPGRGYQHFVYSCVPKADAKTARLRAATEAAGGVWRDVGQLPEGELAALVRRDEVDVLVELTGHTANNRLGTMASRPAPVQVTWIGYPNSTGLRAVDYRFTDAVCDPWDTKQTFVEELVRLPGCFLCYTPAVDAPPVSPPPALANGFITFGSFNNLAKITPQVLRVWGAILTAVPRSRLVLKNKPFACEAARSHVLQQLAAVGVEPWRVDLLPLAPGNAQHLATYSLMDISLDPFPYAGTTTTTESLYMGVPCLTLAGSCHAHNVGVSLLTAVGLHPPASLPAAAAGQGGDRTGSSAAVAGGEAGGEGSSGSGCGSGGVGIGSGSGSGSSSCWWRGPSWVAHSEAEYVALAVAHAANVQALAELRSCLRQRMLDSPMCDGPRFVRGVEDLYRQLWRRHVANAEAGAGAASNGSRSAAPAAGP